MQYSSIADIGSGSESQQALRASTTTRPVRSNLLAGGFVQHSSAQHLSGVFNFRHFLISSLTLLHGSHCDQESNYLSSGCAK